MASTKSDETLKELLKPPFFSSYFSDFDNGVFASNHHLYATSLLRSSERIIESFPGLTVKRLLKFVAQAMNEKWERDYGEPKRWIKTRGYFDDDPEYQCENCGRSVRLENGSPDDNHYNYCPYCGARLRPPGEGLIEIDENEQGD